MIQDALQIKEKIINFIRLRGPSLPVHISKETGLSILFASAFLSDLYSEKAISISNLKVGSSPLYFIPGQEPQLENFSKYLKSKEKEAFLILKEKKFLRDTELQPAIRVALREIKDFAIPFRKDEEIYWRYFTISEENFESEKPKVEEKIEIIEISPEQRIIEIEEEPEKEEVKEEKKIENIFDDTEKQDEEIAEPFLEQTPKKEKPRPHAKKKNQNKKKDENFFNKIKEFLEKKGVEILDIKDFRNDEAILKIKKDRKEELLFVFNKKKIDEKEILKSHKKASEENLKYSILSLAEAPKKLNDLIEAVKNLSEIEKLE